MDLIDRQATLDAVDNIHQEHLYKQIGDRDTYTPYNEGWADACDRIDSVLRGLPSAQRWIPCSERLPEELLPVLVAVREKDRKAAWATEKSWHYVTAISALDGGVWDYYGDQVAAWMPLPEPYKGGE